MVKLIKPHKTQAVCCDSSGSHGQALSWAAAECGIYCHVALPKSAPGVKVTVIKEFHRLFSPL